MRVDGSRIRKEKVADSKISGYVWTGPKIIRCRFLCVMADVMPRQLSRDRNPDLTIQLLIRARMMNLISSRWYIITQRCIHVSIKDQ